MAIYELYSELETGLAHRSLETLVTRIPEPPVLLGGWAVYLTVREDFSSEYGSDYLGSRDIDLGFHIDPTMDIGSLKASELSLAIGVMRDLGYWPDGMFRFCRIVHRETGGSLTEEGSKGVPLHDIFRLYIDLIVDRVHPDLQGVLGFKPIDEPILARAFDDRAFSSLDLGGASVLIPEPYLLVAMKLAAIPDRTRDDKRVKDSCDIYALLWNSPVEIEEIVGDLRRYYPHLCGNADLLIEEGLAAEASGHLGIESEVYAGVIEHLR